MPANQGIPVKTFSKLLTLVVLSTAPLAHAATNRPPVATPTPTAPALSPEVEAWARAQLEKAYAQTDPAGKGPARPLPARITNAPAGTTTPATATTAAPQATTVTAGPTNPLPQKPSVIIASPPGRSLTPDRVVGTRCSL